MPWRIYRELSFKVYIESFLFSIYEEWLETLRLQHAISAGIATGLFGKPPVTFEQLFHGAPAGGAMAYHDTPDGQQPSGLIPLVNFPHDVKLLSAQSVNVMLKASQKRGDEKWTTTRAKAALGEDVLAARMAQSDDLWDRYSRYRDNDQPVTLDQAKVWAELEWNERILKPSSYFRTIQKRHGNEPEQAWQETLGPQKVTQVQEDLFQLAQQA
jgi:hypothetical protein